MLKMSEIRKVNELNDLISGIDSIINSVNSEYVRATAGVVYINSGSAMDAKLGDGSKFFHNRLSKIEKEMEGVLINRLKAEKAKLKAELSKYVKG